MIPRGAGVPANCEGENPWMAPVFRIVPALVIRPFPLAIVITPGFSIDPEFATVFWAGVPEFPGMERLPWLLRFELMAIVIPETAIEPALNTSPPSMTRDGPGEPGVPLLSIVPPGPVRRAPPSQF